MFNNRRERRIMKGFKIILVVFLIGCGKGQSPRTQIAPNIVKKSIFSPEHEWYFRWMIVEASPMTGVGFIGLQSFSPQLGAVDRIRWEIQEKYLIAYRTFEDIPGACRNLKPEDCKGAPVAIYKIEKHFDLKKAYNPISGEEYNKMEENTKDRHWYEREYMRVDWSRNLVKSLSAGFDNPSVSPVAYYIHDPEDPDAPIITEDYIDITNRFAYRPSIAACVLIYWNMNCGTSDIKIRNSFLRIDPKEEYEPLFYPDNEILKDKNGKIVRDKKGKIVRIPYFDRFGYYRNVIQTWDPQYGAKEQGRIYQAYRFNIWQEIWQKDKDGNFILDENGKRIPIPYRQRKVRPIVYYLSPNFPEELKETAYKVGESWNEAFKEVVATLRLLEARGEKRKKGVPFHVVKKEMEKTEDVFVICDNPGVPGEDPGYEKDGSGICGQPYITRRIGDLRYSFLNWVDKIQAASPLGFGPMSADPLTGRIISGNAHLYGAGVDRYAQAATEVVQLINGKINIQDFIEGESGGALKESSSSLNEEWFKVSEMPSYNLEEIKEIVNRAIDHKRLKMVLKQGIPEIQGRIQDPMDLLSDEEIYELFVPQELKEYIGLEDNEDKEILDVLSLRDSLSFEGIENHRQRLNTVLWHMMTPPDFIDDAVYGLALELKDLPEDELYQELRKRIFKGLAEHEIGHSIGLTHNFAASADPLNYFPQYWPLRERNIEKGLLTELDDEQKKGKMREYQYSSTMDYHGRFNLDFHGIGYYDKAAIKFGYGQIVEAFEFPPTDPLLEYYDLKTVLHNFRHYTSYPKIFHGSKNIARRKNVLLEDIKEEMIKLKGRTSLWEVPYRMCEADRAGTASYPLCNMWDEGADSFEIVRNLINKYKTYYIFRNFPRGKVRGQAATTTYIRSLLSRYLLRPLVHYQNYFYRYKDMTRLWQRLYEEKKVGERKWSLDLDGGLSQAIASIEGLEFLLSLIATPEPGSYGLRESGVYIPLYWIHGRWQEEDRFFDLCKEPDTAYSTRGRCSDLNIPIGEGKYLWTEGDWGAGLRASDLRIKRIGANVDRIAALFVMGYYQSNFLGVEQPTDQRRYFIGYYQMWPEFITNLFSALITRIPLLYIRRATGDLNKILNEIAWTTNRYFGWTVKEGKKGEKIITPPRPFTSRLKKGDIKKEEDISPHGMPPLRECTCPNEDSPVSECTCETGRCTEFREKNVCIQPSVYARLWYSLSYSAVLYSMTFLRAIFDQSFNDKMKIFCKGCADKMEIDENIPEEDIVECQDPQSRRTFIALRPQISGEFSPGYELVKRCRDFYPYRSQIEWLWNQTINIIDFVRRTYFDTQYVPLRRQEE
jgi:hypothetical protein